MDKFYDLGPKMSFPSLKDQPAATDIYIYIYIHTIKNTFQSCKQTKLLKFYK